MAAAAPVPDAYWSVDPAALARALDSGPGGLGTAAAHARLRRDGPNLVQQDAGGSAGTLLLRQFQNPLVLVLVFAAFVALALKEWTDAGIILAIVIGSCVLAFLQEWRASRAVADLRRRLALTARVRRDGRESELRFADIVAGDLVLLSAGAMIPADGVVLSSRDLLVSQAAMTGESFPVEKRPGAVAADATMSERFNLLFMGASVRSGTGEMLVVRTGLRTAFGDIAARLRAAPPETGFARGLRQFGTMLLRVMVVMVLFVLTVNQLLHRPFIDSLLFAVALAVGLSPELLPAIVTVTLSAGARALALRGVIVRRLEAIENLGGMSVLCTDKTGTLTQGRIRLEAAVGPDGAANDEVARLAFLNAAFETGIANPMDEAIVAAGRAGGLSERGWRKFAEIPYDFSRKRLTVVVGGAGETGAQLMITKGAFDQVLEVCSEAAGADGPRPITEVRSELERYFRKRGEEGFRVLGVATRTLDPRGAFGRGDERDMRFEGFLVFMDPPKADARAAIAELAALGVAIKVISGDNRHVTAHVASALGLTTRGMLTGEELARTREEALLHRVRRASLFVEIDPQQKERIVRALQKTGETVGFLGDGVNDAPALHAADVGISVDGAVDVARESADVVLLQRDLGVLRQGVEGGRRTFANTLKYVCITISANFGNMVSMALATPLLPFLPLAATQILLNNFMSDLPNLAIAADRVDPERVSAAQTWGIGDIQRFMIVFGLVSSVFDLMTFGVLVLVFHAQEKTFQTGWFVVSLLTELVVLVILRTQRPAWKSRPGRLLLWSLAGVAVAACALPYLDGVARAFGFTPLPGGLMAVLGLIVALYAAATEAAKRLFFRRLQPGAARPRMRRVGRR
jgi:Mg2+-importing ATPase